jgi:hypothetical protein
MLTLAYVPGFAQTPAPAQQQRRGSSGARPLHGSAGRRLLLGVWVEDEIHAGFRFFAGPDLDLAALLSRGALCPILALDKRIARGAVDDNDNEFAGGDAEVVLPIRVGGDIAACHPLAVGVDGHHIGSLKGPPGRGVSDRAFDHRSFLELQIHA